MKNIAKIAHSARGYFHQYFAGPQLRKSVNRLPVEIGDYTLIWDFQPEKNFPFKVGLYQNQPGHKIVVKIWQGKFRDIHYYDLLHQKDSMEILEKIHRRSAKLLPYNLQNIRFPKVEFCITEKNRLLLASEYVSGTPLLKINNEKKQLEIYHQVVSYLQSLGNFCTPEERSVLRPKSIFSYLGLFPFLFAVAILENPADIWLLFELGFVYLISSLGFISHSRPTLVHGDLNFKNINLKGRSRFILDTEQLSFTYPEFELATSISTLSTPYHFKAHMVDNINEFAKTGLSHRLKIVFLLLNCELHNLTWHAPLENRLWYKKVINFALDLFWQNHALLTVLKHENVYD